MRFFNNEKKFPFLVKYQQFLRVEAVLDLPDRNRCKDWHPELPIEDVIVEVMKLHICAQMGCDQVNCYTPTNE
jgi:hypothetical protein